MAERDEPQINFRVREASQKDELTDALKAQTHIPNATIFFQFCIAAIKAASDRGELVEWPLEFVTKPRRPSGSADR